MGAFLHMESREYAAYIAFSNYFCGKFGGKLGLIKT